MAYFVIHSLLASEKAKAAFGNPKWYRLFYVLQSIILLVPIFFYRLQIPTEKLFEASVGTKIPSIGLGYVAFVLFKQAAQVYDLKAFLGLRERKEQGLITHGILARVRHPFYTATVALGLGFLIYSPTITNAIMIGSWFLYLPIGIWLEEKKLISEYGEAYRVYQKSTPVIFPRLFK
jgi:protein-S-isoprenylcysteine O-methyltransferase Ste14